MSRSPPKGNKRGIKIKPLDVRQIAYQDFLAHLAEGYPVEAWTFDHEKDGKTFSCHWQTMLSYIKENPSEFDALLMQKARAKGYRRWFGRGANLSDGLVKGNPSPQAWATIMRNMYKWDRFENTATNQEHFDTKTDELRQKRPLDAPNKGPEPETTP